MSRRLRSQTIREMLQRDDDEDGDPIDEASSEEDIVYEDSADGDSDFQPSSSDENAMEIDDEDLEDSTLEQRILQVRKRQKSVPSRGRPSKILRGKNGYKWHTDPSSRNSGM